MTTTSARQIFTMAVDLKVPEHGPIQILEFMAGHHAGQKGYRQLEGRDMITDHVLPYLQQVYPDEIVEQIPPSKYPAMLHQLGERYGYLLADKGSGILYPSREVTGQGYYHLTRSDLQFARHYPEFTFINTDQQMLLTEHNKAAQAYLVKEDEILSKYYTPSFVTTTRYHEDKADRIINYLKHDGDYVLKPVDQSQGNGVRIVAADKLDDWLHTTLVKKRAESTARRAKDYWMTDINPVFLVQPYIASRPVKYQHQDYDGTLRVFVTIHRDGENDPWIAKVHDGYWKLPSMPLLSSSKTLEQSISHSPDRAESDSNVVATMALLAHALSFRMIPLIRPSSWRGKMNSVGMTDGLRGEIFPQIEEFCARLPEVMQRKSLYQRTWNHLASNSRPRQGTGMLMATHPTYYVGSEADPLPLNANAFPPAYLDRMRHFCLKDAFTNAAAVYIDGLTRDQNQHHYAEPVDILLKDKKFVSEMRARHRDTAGFTEFMDDMVRFALFRHQP